MNLKVDCLYICPWSLQDPLCRSQSLSYVRGLVSAGYRFAFITFENERFLLPPDERERLQRELKDEGIIWYPVKWDQGVGLGSKLRSLTAAIATGIKAARRHQPKLVHSRSSLPVVVSLTLQRLFGSKFLYDADSVLSEEYVDVGHLSRESRGYKLMAKSEAMARRRADHMIVLTEALRERFVRDV